jgi:hypothetical protein
VSPHLNCTEAEALRIGSNTLLRLLLWIDDRSETRMLGCFDYGFVEWFDHVQSSIVVKVADLDLPGYV